MYSILLSSKMPENIGIFGSSGNCVEASYRSEFLPRDGGGWVGNVGAGLKPAPTMHSLFVPSTEGNVIELG